MTDVPASARTASSPLPSTAVSATPFEIVNFLIKTERTAVTKKLAGINLQMEYINGYESNGRLTAYHIRGMIEEIADLHRTLIRKEAFEEMVSVVK